MGKKKIMFRVEEALGEFLRKDAFEKRISQSEYMKRLLERETTKDCTDKCDKEVHIH